MIGKNALKGFDKYLAEKERPLTGVVDFLGRIPHLFYMQVSEGGNAVPGSNVLNIRSNQVFCCGHHMEFLLFEDDPSKLRTVVDYAHENPKREKSLEVLGRLVRNPPNVYDSQNNRLFYLF